MGFFAIILFFAIMHLKQIQIHSIVMEINYLNHDDFGIDPEYFAGYLGKLENETELMKGILNVIFVNDPYIHALNKAYRDKDKPTDVLSFNYQGEDSELLGEVYISVDTAKKQAVDHEHSFEDELIKLIVHGILHVHGFDHIDDQDYKKMYAVEKAVLGDLAGPFIEHE